MPSFSITSPAFAQGEAIPVVHTCDGKDSSPLLSWNDPSPEARSFVLIVDDPDAPRGTFTHWVLFDIPTDAHELPSGEHKLGVAGRNDFGSSGYRGPCPPRGGPHRYYFRLFVLDVESLKLPAGAARPQVEHAMQGHVLAQAELMGRYTRAAASA